MTLLRNVTNLYLSHNTLIYKRAHVFKNSTHFHFHTQTGPFILSSRQIYLHYRRTHLFRKGGISVTNRHSQDVCLVLYEGVYIVNKAPYNTDQSTQTYDQSWNDTWVKSARRQIKYPWPYFIILGVGVNSIAVSQMRSLSVNQIFSEQRQVSSLKAVEKSKLFLYNQVLWLLPENISTLVVVSNLRSDKTAIYFLIHCLYCSQFFCL